MDPVLPLAFAAATGRAVRPAARPTARSAELIERFMVFSYRATRAHPGCAVDGPPEGRLWYPPTAGLSG
ncbi:hypothetical protein GCM10023221_18000 [Luteimicrobium xylanilyticum]